jgi:hypothetical protein
MGYLDLVKAVEARLNERCGSAPRGAVAPSVPTAISVESVDASSAKPPLAARAVGLDGAAGGAAAASVSRGSRRRYSYPWPDALLGLGCRSTGPFDKCCQCSAWSWVRYDGVVFCVRCAVRRAATDDASNRENSQ